MARAKRNLRARGRSITEPIRILHLSDLHISNRTKVGELLRPLLADVRDKSGGLGFNKLDYLVVSGDISDRANLSEFETARAFTSGLISELGLNAERCIIVPGNHDVNWEIEAYHWLPGRKVRPETLPPGSCVAQGSGFLVRDDKSYNERFKSFSEDFYHTLTQRSYPLEPERQCIDFFFPDDGIQFIGLNSCWEIDEQFPDRASINKEALAQGIWMANRSLTRQKWEQRDRKLLRIGVWHHPIAGSERIENDAFLGQLQQAGMRLALHGHVHEDRAEVIRYLHGSSSIFTAGAGSFGAPMKGRPESTPRLYNLIEVARDLKSLRVHTRCLRKDGGAWEGWAVWPGSSPTERRSYYEITPI